MRLANPFVTTFGALVIALVATAPAQAQHLSQSAEYAGTIQIDSHTQKAVFSASPSGVETVGDVYNNVIPRPAVALGIALTDPAAVLGDRVATTAPGLMQEFTVSFYNGDTNGGIVTSLALEVDFYNAGTSTLLGSVQLTGLGFGQTGLTPGHFVLVGDSGLGSLGIVLPQDVLVTQRIIAMTGNATTLGVVSFDPPNVGSSQSTMYINSSTVGPAGYYAIGNPPVNANPGYSLNVTPITPAVRGTWGKVKALYHA